MTPEAIRNAAAELRRTTRMRHVEVAQSLGISEGQLVAAHVGQDPVTEQAAPGTIGSVRLRSDWPALLAALERVGEVMALTRNAACVHEKVGVYRQSSVENGVGLVLGGAIDLRIFYRHWVHGFAVCERNDKGLQQSLQFFDANGRAIHKVFAKPATDLVAWAQLQTEWTAADQAPGMQVDGSDTALPATAAGVDVDKAALQDLQARVDVAAFRQAWATLRDTHDFVKLLKEYGVSRLEALRLADAQFVQPVEASAAHALLEGVAREHVPIMVFVSNEGMVQIHTGEVHKIVIMGPWLNVLDEGFNLHLRQDLIATAWVVRKPTVDGMVTSLELLDAQGQLIAQFFGARKPGSRELCEWRTLVDKITLESELCNV